MTVELLDSPRFYGFRVRRQIGGKTYQEYFPLKEDGTRLRGLARSRVKDQAEARDEELAEQQKSLRDKAAKTVHISGRGQVRGILCREKSEKSGNKTPVFQIGVKSEVEQRIVNTTVSINRYGVHEAWLKAVEFYAQHKKLSKRSRAYKELLAAEPTAAQVRRVTSGRGSKRRRKR